MENKTSAKSVCAKTALTAGTKSKAGARRRPLAIARRKFLTGPTEKSEGRE